MRLLNDDLLPALEREGIRLMRVSDLDDETQATLERVFDDSVFPVLTPLAVDSGHPFPYISNLSLSLAVELEETTRDGIELHFARVKIPPTLPRFVPLEMAPPGERRFILLEDLIAHHLDGLISRDARSRRLPLSGHARRRLRLAGRRSRRSIARDRVGTAAPPVRRAGSSGNRTRNAGIHARFFVRCARSHRGRLLTKSTA